MRTRAHPVSGRPRRIGLGTLAGIAGPAAFTAAWLVSGLRQRGYSILHEHISGLAAPDARDPEVMIGGFLALGGSMILFARDLRRRLSTDGDRPGPGPALMALSGLCTVAAGMLRRDRMANRLPGETEPTRQSAVNDWHDRMSIGAQTLGFASTVALSRRFRGEPGLADLPARMLGAGAIAFGLAAYFGWDTQRPGNGIVQRVGVTISLAGLAGLAARLLRPGPPP